MGSPRQASLGLVQAEAACKQVLELRQVLEQLQLHRGRLRECCKQGS